MHGDEMALVLARGNYEVSTQHIRIWVLQLGIEGKERGSPAHEVAIYVFSNIQAVRHSRQRHGGTRRAAKKAGDNRYKSKCTVCTRIFVI
jgi:hypothetical protein